MNGTPAPAGHEEKRRIPPVFFAYAADFVSVFLLSLGLYTAYLSVTYWDIPPHICMGLILLSLIILFVLRLRWWVTPALLGAGVLLVFLLLQVSGQRDEFVAYWTSFLNWAAHMAPYSEYFQESGGEAFLQFLIALGVTAVLFILVRRFFSFLFLAVLHIAVYFLLLRYQNVDLSGPLLLTIAGMIILLPRLFSRYMERRETVPERSKTENSQIARGRMQIIAIPIALVIIGLCQLLIPADTGVWKSRGLNLLADDVATLMGDPFASSSSFQANFDLRSYGYNRENGKLGGPANLHDDLVLQVEADRAVLLRGAVYDRYTGESWKESRPDGDFRYHGMFMGQFRDTAFPATPIYPQPDSNALYEALTNRVSLTIKYNRSSLTTVFTAGNLRGYTIRDSQLNAEVYFNLRGDMYLHRRIPAQTELMLEGDVWRWWDKDFYEHFLQLESDALAVEDSGMEATAARYTVLPETLPDSVWELTDEITAGLDTPYERAHAIERWIAENCTYTLTPAVPPEDEDFVAHFLTTREGYCVYYATAMAVMARQAGIPARYVTGFGMENAVDSSGTPRETYSYNATGTTAHAWAELYFHGIGWVDFDPTRGSTGDILIWQEIELEDEPVMEAAPSPSPTPTPMPVPGEVLEDGPEEIEENQKGKGFLIGVIVAAVALTALYLTYRYLRQRKLRGYRIQRVRAIRKDTAEQFDYYFTDLLKQLQLLQLESWPGETLTAFSKHVDRRLEIPNFSFREIAGVQMQVLFREVQPSAGDVETVNAYHERLEVLLIQRLSKPKYFFLRALR